MENMPQNVPIHNDTPKEEKKYLYHMASTDKEGNIVREGDHIHPLNVLKEMKDVNPKLYNIYEKVVSKYEGRKLFPPGIAIPTLEAGTKWADVVQLSPIHPDDLRAALQEGGFELGDRKFYQIDPDTLDLKNTTVFLYDDNLPDDHPENYAEYDASKIEQHADVKRLIEEYQKEKKRREDLGIYDPKILPALFVQMPHYFYKGSIDVSKLPVITAKLKEDAH